MCVYVLVTQACPTHCNPMDYSLSACSVHGTFKARILEWVVIFFSRLVTFRDDENVLKWIMAMVTQF